MLNDLPVMDVCPWRYWATHSPQAVALRTESDTLSWQQLAHCVAQRAAYLAECGVSEGCAVALIGRNSPALLLNYLAVMECGARVVPVNPQLPRERQVALCAALDVRFGIAMPATDGEMNAEPAVVDAFDSAGVEMLTAPLLFSVLLFNVDAAHSASSAANAALDVSPVVAAAPVAWDASRPATVTLTSGSGSLPKGVVHSAACHLASADGLLQMLPFTVHDSWLLSLPLFHVSGQGIVWRWLLRGATLVCRPLRDLAQALQGCSHASLVPTQLYRLLQQPQSLPSLRQVLLGGAVIPVELTQQAQAAGVHCWCGYGMTEMASTVTAKAADSRSGVGLCLPRRELCLRDEEVWVRGAPLALGYWRDGALQPLTNDQGWFATRDRGCMRDGELVILGRLDNLFISGGENIQPEQIERGLALHPQVLQAFVVPVADAEFGQRPVAVLQFNSSSDTAFDASAVADDLRSWAKTHLAGFQRPLHYFCLPDGFGGGGIKIARKAVADWLASGPLPL